VAEDGKLAGLVPTRAERLNLGALVRVRPGQRVPVDGFVVNVSAGAGASKPRVSPFAYAVTGEATVKAGLRPLPVAWDGITSVLCGVRLGRLLERSSPPDDDLDDAVAAAASGAFRGGAGPRSAVRGRTKRALSDAAPGGPRSLPGSPGRDATPLRRTPSRSSAAEGLPMGPAGGLDDAACPADLRAGPHATTPHGPSALQRSASAPALDDTTPSRRPAAVQWLREDIGNVARGLAGIAPIPRGSPAVLPARPASLGAGSDASATDTEAGAESDGGTADSASTASAAACPAVQILVNGHLSPDPQSAVSRGMVHAPPPGDASDLFLLAGVPAQDNPEENNAAEPDPSEWDTNVRVVLIVQLAVAVAVSVQGWASGTVIRDVDVTLWSAAAFLLGQLVMNNGLVPIRAKLSVQFWMLAVKWYFGSVTVKRETVLETIRGAKDVVSDKTGTLTVDGMAFASPLPTPWTPGPMAAFHLLLTNDTAPNPLFRAPAEPAPGAAPYPRDPGLLRLPTLATTTEEGVIFDALASDRDDSGRASLVGGDHLSGSATRPFPVVFEPVVVPGPDSAASADAAPAARSPLRAPLLLVCRVRARTRGGEPVAAHPDGPAWAPLPAGDEGSASLLALLHYRGPFEPVYIGRFAVATVFERTGDEASLAGSAEAVRAALERTASERLCGTAKGDAIVTAALTGGGWALRETVLAMQGGGDVVAGLCADPGAAEEEERQLERDPNRTFGHAVAALGAVPCGVSGVLCRDDVVALHDTALAAPAGPGPAAAASGYALEFLSKFENPLSSDVHRVPSILGSQGVRFHCCTGDTLLTMRAILRRMGVVAPAQRASGDAGFEFTPLHGPALADAVETTAHACAGDDPARKAALVDDLLRTSEITLGPDEADTIRAVLSGPVLPTGAAVAADPLTCAERLLDQGRRVVFLCSQPALEALHEHRGSGRVRGILSSPSVTMAFFRIRHNVKPKALALFAPGTAPDDLARAQAEADAGRVRSPAPIFIGDGTNDEPALLETAHSIAIAQGSLAARNAANIEVLSAAALPDVISMARLAHGGRAIVLRDVLFAGGYLVAMLAVSAHIVHFKPMAENTLVIVEDPWNQLMTVLITLMIVTPRSLILAFTDGMQPAYRNHTTLVRSCLIETIAAIATAIFTGLYLAPDQAALDRDRTTAINDFAVMAVASLALTMYLRQNLIISDEVTIRPRILPPIAFDGDDAADHGIPSSATPATRGSAQRHMPLVVWALTGVLAQVAVFLLFCALIASKTTNVAVVVFKVGTACLPPTAVMVAYRLVVSLSRAKA